VIRTCPSPSPTWRILGIYKSNNHAPDIQTTRVFHTNKMVWLRTTQTYRGRVCRFYSTAHTIYLTRKPIKPFNLLASVENDGFHFSLRPSGYQRYTLWNRFRVTVRKCIISMCEVQSCSGTAFRSNEFPVNCSCLRASSPSIGWNSSPVFRWLRARRRCNIGKTHTSHQCILFVALGRLNNHIQNFI